jgi:glycosyltransferase involved in cell wall biosynthesis
MKILLISEYFPDSPTGTITGGVEARVWFLSRLLALRHDVSVIASWRRSQHRFQIIHGVKVYRPGQHHDYANEGAAVSRLRFALAAYRLGRTLGPFDIVDGCTWIAYPPAYFIARSVGARAVASYNEVWCGTWVATKGLPVGILGEIWERLTLRLPWDHFVAISGFTASRLMAFGIPAGSITVIPCGVDLKQIQTITAAPRRAGSICMVARLVRGKQPQLVLQALKIIVRSHPHLIDRLQLTVCGEGPLLETCQQMAASLGIASLVRFVGWLPAHDDVLRLMKESSLLVHPSTVEGFGIVFIEACACGTPVLAADIPVVKEVTALLGGGRTFHSGSAEDLAKNLLDHLGDQPIPVGRVDHLDWETISRHLVDCYAKLLDQVPLERRPAEE